jgi:2-oxoglutarate dehydrogenase complex dehydrogenase (E1) component-like enzyme
VNEFTDGYFQEVLPDHAIKDKNAVKRIVISTGKIFYDLSDEREKNANDGSVALIRLEQLYPFPAERLSSIVKSYPNVKQIIWAQEEPKNMGAYSFVAPRLQEIFMELATKGVGFRYVGRTERASPAIGSPKIHQQEQMEIVKSCFK